jgi:PTH2 family peptidyl-tRNA hydrolase
MTATPTLVILLNDELYWTRGKRAAHAVHAVLHLNKISYDTAVVVLNGKPREVANTATAHVTDLGDRVIAGADWQCTEGGREGLVIRVDTSKTKSRDDTAIAAVRVALKAHGIEWSSIAVRGSSKDEILELADVVINDAGHTELEPGTLTAGAFIYE